VKRAIVTGQYHDPKGLYYSGTSLEPSHVLLSTFIKDQGFDTSISGTVTWLDVHTGLGPPGVDTLLPSSIPGAGPETAKWFKGADIQDPSVGSGGDVAAGYEYAEGFLEDLYSYSFPAAKELPLVIVQEFGTRPGILVARAMILEHMAFIHDPANQPQWSTYTRDVFYVRTKEWKESVATRGILALFEAIQRSSQ